MNRHEARAEQWSIKAVDGSRMDVGIVGEHAGVPATGRRQFIDAASRRAHAVSGDQAWYDAANVASLLGTSTSNTMKLLRGMGRVPMTTYIRFPWDECLMLGAKWCPSKDLSTLHRKLERHSKLVSRLPVDSAPRQLLAALRLRELFRRSLAFAKFKDDLHYWVTLQSGCPGRA